jgi:hypothetical protein
LPKAFRQSCKAQKEECVLKDVSPLLSPLKELLRHRTVDSIFIKSRSWGLFKKRSNIIWFCENRTERQNSYDEQKVAAVKFWNMVLRFWFPGQSKDASRWKSRLELQALRQFRRSGYMQCLNHGSGVL